MTRYAQLVVLLLSFLLPLQVGAEALFTASCPQMISTQAMPAAKASTMGCCGEAAQGSQKKGSQKKVSQQEESTAKPCAEPSHSDEPQKTSHCQSAFACSLCKTPAQLNLLHLTLIANDTNLSRLHIAPYSPSVTFNPASIWRPPCIS